MKNLVLAGDLVAGGCVGANQRAQPSIGADDIGLFEIGHWKGTTGSFQDVGDVLGIGRHVGGIAFVLGIGGTKNAELAPGDEEHQPPVSW